MALEKLNKRKILILALLFLVFLASLLLSLGNGAVKVGPKEIIRVLFIDSSGKNFQIIYNVRLPRTLVAMMVGVSLSLSGAILQGIMRNPLAGPNIIGVSSGGGFFAYLILIAFPHYYHLVPLGAFLGALAATLFIYSLSWKEGALPSRMILAGVAVSSLFTAGTNALLTFFPDRVQGVLSFMVGGLAAITWQDVWLILPYCLVGMLLVLLLPGKLNILMLGDEVARGLGVRVERTRLLFIVISSILAGAAVSVVGLLGFVGLIVPHMVRLILGSDYRYLFPGTILFGASMVMVCDTLARTLFAPADIPVGIIMSILGAPFFLHLLRRRERL